MGVCVPIANINRTFILACISAVVRAAYCNGRWEGVTPGPYHWTSKCLNRGYPIESREEVRAALQNRVVSFVGDSTTREFVYDVALWIGNCTSSSESPAAAVDASTLWSDPVCAVVSRLRQIRNVNETELRVGSGVLRYFRVEQVRTLLSKPWAERLLFGWDTSYGNGDALHSDAIVFNAGLWNLRHDRYLGSPSAISENLLSEVDTLLAKLTSSPHAAKLRSRLLWRSMLPLEPRVNVTTVGAFTPNNVATLNNKLNDRWASAGFQVVDVWQYGLHEFHESAQGGSGFTTAKQQRDEFVRLTCCKQLTFGAHSERQTPLFSLFCCSHRLQHGREYFARHHDMDLVREVDAILREH